MAKTKDDEKAKALEKASETLLGPDHFKYPAMALMDSQFECKDATYLNNMGSPAWQEPRMFTLQQLRDTFYAVML